MKITAYALTFGIAVTLTGCDAAQLPKSPVVPKVSYQRFVPIPPPPQFIEGIPWHGYLALDTKTGTLCATMLRSFKGGGVWANDVPQCSQLLEKYPD